MLRAGQESLVASARSYDVPELVSLKEGWTQRGFPQTKRSELYLRYLDV